MTGLTIDRINGLSGNLAFKAPVLAATTGPITLSGLQTIDGIAVPVGGRVLVKDQVDPTQNGWYDASTSSWSRCLDADGNSDLTAGTLCLAAGGATYAGVVFRLLCATTNVLPGTSAITFQPSLSLTAISAFMLTLLDDTDAATARTTLGAAGLGANTFTDDQTLGAGKALIFEGATDNGFETTLTVTDPTADRTITLPNVSLTVAGTDVAQTFGKPQTAQPGALTSSTTWDGSTLQSLTVDVNGSAFTIAAASATPADGTYIGLLIKYTTTHSVAFTTGSSKGFAGVTAFTPTATAGKYDHLVLRWDATVDRFLLVSFTKDCAA